MRTREAFSLTHFSVLLVFVPLLVNTQVVPSEASQDRGLQTAPVSKVSAQRDAAGLPSAVGAKQSVILTSPGVASQGFRRVPQGGGAATSETLFPVGNGGNLPPPVAGSILTEGGRSASSGGGGGGTVTAATTAGPPAPTTTFAGYLVGSPYPFVLPPPDIPYFGSKWNGPWGYPIGHYQAFRGTGQYITHYQYYPLSYFGSLMAPFAYGVSGK